MDWFMMMPSRSSCSSSDYILRWLTRHDIINRHVLDPESWVSWLSWHNDSHTHTHTWAERRDLKINLRKVSPTQISHLSHFASCALNLYLYLLFNFAPLLCILAHFYARLPPRSFAALTAKFNFYCCLTLLNDFYCLSAGPPRSSEERRSLCRNLI